MCGTLPGWSDISPPPGSWSPFRPALERSNKVDGPLIRLLPVRRATHPIRQCTALSAHSSIASLLNKVDDPLIHLLPVRRATHPIRQCTALSARSSIASLLNKVDGPLIRLLPVRRATHPIRQCTALSARSSIASLLNKVDGPLIRLLPVQRATHPIRRVPIGPAAQNPPPADPPPAGPPDHRTAGPPHRRTSEPPARRTTGPPSPAAATRSACAGCRCDAWRMPEGDTVWRTARRLDEALAGQVLTCSDFRVPRFATTDLTGRAVTETVSRGKHLLTRVDGGLTVHTHLRMDGSWRIRPAGGYLPRDHRIRLVLGNDRRQALGYQLGVVEVLPTRSEARAVGHLGPDLLGPDWDATEAVRRLGADPDRPDRKST